MIKVSIILPVYNVEEYIEGCIKSIIQQDCCGVLVECIIINDCSTDNSMGIVYSIIDNYHGDINFLLIDHIKNLGLSEARNTGINKASGDYILFVDSDDWLPDNSISVFIKVLSNNPDIDMISGNSYRTREKRTLIQDMSDIEFVNNYQFRKLLFNHHNVTCSAWNKLIRKDIVIKHKFHEGIIFEDALWIYFLLMDISEIIIIPNVTYIYENDHPSSIANTSRNVDHFQLHIHSVVVMCNEILNSPYIDLYADCQLYFFNYLIIAVRLQHEHKIKCIESDQLKLLRKRFVLDTFNKGRWFLALFFFLLTYPPTSLVLNFRWCRRHYHIMEKTALLIANYLERFH